MPAASPPVPELLAAARAVLWREAGLIPHVGTTDGRSYRCNAVDPETRLPDPRWPTSVAGTELGAVDSFLQALHLRGHAAEDARRADVVRTLATAYPAGATFDAEELADADDALHAMTALLRGPDDVAIAAARKEGAR